MPKAKFKTKGTVQANIEDLHCNCDNDQSVPVGETNLSTMSSLDADFVCDVTEKDLCKKKQKGERIKTNKGGICKSKQLKEKKSKRLKSRQNVAFLPPNEQNMFDSDDEKPLSYASERLHTNCVPSSDIAICSFSENLVNRDNNSLTEINPKKRKSIEMSPPQNVNETPEEVGYTSVIKSASVLLIKKQNVSSIDGSQPAKKSKLNFGIAELITHETPTTSYTNLENNNKLVEFTPSVQNLNENVLDSSVDKKVENNDSDNTETYDYNSITASPSTTVGSNGRPFSPIPSTSKDTEVFEKNDQRFQESLQIDDDVEIIETPVETIIVEDGSPDCEVRETIDITNTDFIDDDVEFVGYATIPNLKNSEIDDIICSYVCSNSIIPKEPVNMSDCEIVDVDSVIANGNATLKRLQRNKTKSTVTNVPPQLNEPTIVADSPVQLTDLTDSTDNHFSFMDMIEQWSATSSVLADPVMASTSTITSENRNQHSYSDTANALLNNNPIPKPQKNGFISNTMSNIRDTISNFVSRTPTVNTYSTSNHPIDLSSAPDRPPINEGEIHHDEGSSSWMNYILDRQLDTDRHQPVPPPSFVFQETVIDPPVFSKPRDSQNSFGKSMECPICMESLSSKPLASTICGHIFCMACIEKALKVPGGKKCPTCRKSFTKKGQSYHPLFL